MLERAFARVYRVIIQRIASLCTGAAQVAARQLSADPFREVQGFFYRRRETIQNRARDPTVSMFLGGLKGESLWLKDKT